MELKLPCVIIAIDYHEFSHLLNQLHTLTGSKQIKYVELERTGAYPRYAAIFYTGNKKSPEFRAVKAAYNEDA